MSVILQWLSKMEHNCKHQDMCIEQLLMEVEVKSNTKRQLVVEFQMQQWCIVTLSLPRPCLWPPERVSARSPPASTWECSDSASIFLNISFLYSSWEWSHSAPIFLNIWFLYFVRATNLLTWSMPFSFSCPLIMPQICACAFSFSINPFHFHCYTSY